jgi:hypothetical protein
MEPDNIQQQILQAPLLPALTERPQLYVILEESPSGIAPLAIYDSAERAAQRIIRIAKSKLDYLQSTLATSPSATLPPNVLQRDITYALQESSTEPKRVVITKTTKTVTENKGWMFSGTPVVDTSSEIVRTLVVLPPCDVYQLNTVIEKAAIGMQATQDRQAADSGAAARSYPQFTIDALQEENNQLRAALAKHRKSESALRVELRNQKSAAVDLRQQLRAEQNARFESTRAAKRAAQTIQQLQDEVGALRSRIVQSQGSVVGPIAQSMPMVFASGGSNAGTPQQRQRQQHHQYSPIMNNLMSELRQHDRFMIRHSQH